ncbi:extracellular solute-binding protein [Paenibacillus sp. LMG 31461]|uniref:Extracellular solute-binding protein n=1 Tax=Paenibacillus plantarum TaxID=2654975 RepID=A0ABX1X6K9_9BACL|nr:extracellular solute-binding protein [Paenibacillus plantarum]NOU64047.1 extracellular solute-binding protein [Paenibacillus plantarum]
MKKVFKSTGLIALAGMMLLTACSSANSGNSTETSKASTAPAATQEAKKADQKPVELTVFVNMPWWSLKDWSGKVPEEITKKTGIKLNVQVATDDKQLPLLIASGDLPDLVYTATDLTRMAVSNVSYPLGDLIKKYAPDFKISKERMGVNTMPDGNFYTIRNAYSTEQEWKDNTKAIPGTSGLTFRQDIMEKIGNPPLNNLDDLTAVLGKVKAQFPDMTPLVWDKDQIGQNLRINFGLKKAKGFVDIDGAAKYYLKDKNYLNYYLYMNNLYRKGYMTAENFTFKDAQQDDQLVLNGKAFAHGHGNADATNAQLEKLGTAFKMTQVTKLLSDQAGVPMGGSGWAGMYITKRNKNPEASIKFLQFMYSEEGQKLGLYGIKGEDWEYNEAEKYPVMKYDFNNAEIQKKMGVVWWGLIGSSGVNEALQRYSPTSQMTQWGLANRAALKFNPALGLVSTEPDTDEQVIENQITNMVTTEELKIYLAASEAEAKANYEAMMKKAEGMGLPKLEAWATTKYKEYQKNF